MITTSYASAAQYIEQFGLREATQLLQDEERLLEDLWLKAHVNGDTSTLSNLPIETLAAVEAAERRLSEALRRSAALMDGYLRGVVSLPLSEAQVEQTDLKTCNAELARCWLMDDTDNATDLAEKRCDRWRSWLRDVAARRVVLLPESDASTLVSEQLTRHGTGRSEIDWTGYP